MQRFNQFKSRRLVTAIVIATAILFVVGMPAIVQGRAATLPNIILVHGAWADGSSWNGVIERLQAKGYNVTAPQFPLNSLADNVARLKQVLEVQNGPTILVAHSYGGQIITALGGDDPKVVGLVYIAGFGLDEGETIQGLLENVPPTPALANFIIDKQGFAWLPEDAFMKYFAPDVDPTQAKVMFAVQQPLSATALGEVMSTPTWKTVPSWFMVAMKDDVVSPDAERFFAKRMGATVVEIDSSHVVLVSHPDEVVKVIEDATAKVSK